MTRIGGPDNCVLADPVSEGRRATVDSMFANTGEARARSHWCAYSKVPLSACNSTSASDAASRESGLGSGGFGVCERVVGARVWVAVSAAKCVSAYGALAEVIKTCLA